MTTDRGDLWGKVLNHFNDDLRKAALWFATPNPLLGNIAPDVMIAAGRKDKVRQFIEDSIKESVTNDFKKASVLQDVPTFTTDGTIMTDKSEKVDGTLTNNPYLQVHLSDEFQREWFNKPRSLDIPVSIMPPEVLRLRMKHSAAEARQAVISELLEWCHGQRNIDHDSLDAKLRKLERVK